MRALLLFLLLLLPLTVAGAERADETFAALLEARIGALADGHGLMVDPADGAEVCLADAVARQVWDEVRQATDGLRGDRP